MTSFAPVSPPQPAPPPQPLLVDGATAAALIGVHPATVAKLPDDKVGRVRIGRRVLYARERLERLARTGQ